MNLNPGGIQTVEFRVKEGSSSGSENRNFIMFLAQFIKSVMDRPGVADQYPANFKEKAWASEGILSRQWNNDRIFLTTDDKMIVDEVFAELMTYITDRETNAYYQGIYDMTCPAGRSAGSPPTKRRRSRRRADVHVVQTSFGSVDYDQVCEKINADPAYGTAQEMIKSIKYRLLAPYVPFQAHPVEHMPLPRMVSTAGSQRKIATRRKVSRTENGF